MGILLILDGDSYQQAVGVACAAFFGLGTVASLLTLMPGRVYLRLIPEGFQYRTVFRTHFIPWSDVVSFGLFKVRSMSPSAVAWKLKESPDMPSRISRRYSGWDGAFPFVFGKTSDDLLTIMNEWRQRYASDARPELE
jgi:hypothetical protein